MGEVARAWCGPGVRGDLPWGEPNHRTAHRAKRASSDRSGFFRPEGFEAGAGVSAGGEGRLGTISAALALSSRNLSNSATQNKAQQGWVGAQLPRLIPHLTENNDLHFTSTPKSHEVLSLARSNLELYRGSDSSK